MRARSASLLLILACPAIAAAQGIVVQQPTFSQFGVGTTVSVPDRGTAYLGGVNRAQSGGSQLGVPMLPFPPFQNRSYGQTRGATSTSVSVYIHDFQELEADLLRQAPLGTTAAFAPVFGPAGPPQAVARQATPAAPRATRDAWEPRVAEPRAAEQLAAAQSEGARLARDRAREAADLFAQGQEAEAEGQRGAARVFYQMASRRAEGAMKQQILARLDALSPPRARPTLAQGAQ